MVKYLFGIGLTFFLLGCESSNSSNLKVFRYNESTGIATLDPAFAKNQSIMWVVHQIFNTLVEVDEQLQIKPSLAYRWEVSKDQKTYWFYLRKGVWFHEHELFGKERTRQLTAYDVEYSLKRIIDPATASSGAWIFNHAINPQTGFKALNDSVFQLQLLKPYPPILGILSMQYCSIVAKEIVAYYGKAVRNHPIGTGPFQFKFWEEGQALVLTKNIRYWEYDDKQQRLPYLDAIQISFFDNKATEFLQFRQKKLSFINDIDPSFKDELLTKNGALRSKWRTLIRLNKSPYLNTEYLGILLDTLGAATLRNPLKFLAIRKAINHAINREQLVMYLRNSIGYPATGGIVPKGLPSQNAEFVKGYEYNIAKAKAYIASVPESEDLTIKLLTIPVYADIGSFVVKELEKVGLKASVEVIQKSLLLEQTAKSKAHFFRGSWIADYPDAENYLAMFYSKNPAPPNYTRFKNKQFDSWYEAALQTTNDSIRYELYRKMDQMVMDYAAVVPLWYDMIIHLVQPHVQNFKPNALNLLELRKVNLKN